MTAADAMGLPEGVSYVRIGAVKLEELYLQDGRIHRGPRPGANIVVQLAAGYTLVYDIQTDGHIAAQAFDPPQEVLLRCRAANAIELSDIIGLKKRLKDSGVLVDDEDQKPGEPASDVQPPVELAGDATAGVRQVDPGSGVVSAGASGH